MVKVSFALLLFFAPQVVLAQYYTIKIDQPHSARFYPDGFNYSNHLGEIVSVEGPWMSPVFRITNQQTQDLVLEKIKVTVYNRVFNSAEFTVELKGVVVPAGQDLLLHDIYFVFKDVIIEDKIEADVELYAYGVTEGYFFAFDYFRIYQ